MPRRPFTAALRTFIEQKDASLSNAIDFDLYQASLQNHGNKTEEDAEWDQLRQEILDTVSDSASELDSVNSWGSRDEFGSDLPFGAKYELIDNGGPQPSVYHNVDAVEAKDVLTAPTSFSAPAEAITSDPPVYDRHWLLRQCELHVGSAESVTLTPTQFCTDIFAMLRSSRNDEDIQSGLVDLLGYSNFSLIQTLLLHRQTIVKQITEDAATTPERKVDQDQQVERLSNQNGRPPVYGAQVTIMSEAEKLHVKQSRKEQKKRGKTSKEETTMMASATMLGLDGDHLRNVREEQLRNATSAPLPSYDGLGANQEVLPNVYQSSTGGSTLSSFGSRFVLPRGTTREDYKDYEEIIIPTSRLEHPVVTNKLIPISDLDEYARAAFQGYKSLNRVQSIVYPIAYKTNENLLICAPTGAGKTDIAMLTVLRTLMQNVVNGNLAKNNFKIVYVAPMKALAAEVVRKFSKRLGGSESSGGLGISVRELTGDMQLTKAEISATQMIVTTPEKWDVVTRKSVGDTELTQKVQLLIIDEVHLLHEDRGSVIESIVARTLRQVESSQSMIRIVGLSATLPNYLDVASFLGVNKYQGLFYFDSSFRPVPLEQHFIGVKGKAGSHMMRRKMDEVCYDEVSRLIKDGGQVMVFVHSRKDTVRTAQMLRDEALSYNELGLFDTSQDPAHGLAVKDVQRSRNKELRELFSSGFGIHNAGMLRSDRNLTERLFERGLLKVLCCTATLAWGVNLPAFAVVIKGTQIYDAKKGGFIDLSILDVLQIFGRAGRPQYEDRGLGVILTSHDKLSHYVSAMTQQHPIESRFAENLVDNLNAEISLGTVTSLDEGVRWLSYTYLYTRMKKNPFQYGLNWSEIQNDPSLSKRRRDLLIAAAKTLSKAQMIIFDEERGYLNPKDLGRTSSSFYIQTASIEIYNEMMRPRMTEADVLCMLSMSTEFENIKVREEEIKELKGLEENDCICAVKGSVDTNYGKTNILLQAYISRARIEDFALVSDTAYIAQNSARILRALFQIAVNRNWGPSAAVILSLCKSVDKRLWPFEHPLAQFDVAPEIVRKLENVSPPITVDVLREMDVVEIGQLIRHQKMAPTVIRCAEQFPSLFLHATVAPITRTVLRVALTITPDFVWNERVHGSVEPWWIFVEDSENSDILYSDYFLLRKRQQDADVELNFTIPLPSTQSTVDELPSQVYIRAISDKWIGAEVVIPVSFKHLILPALNRTPHTDLLNLQPLPITALQNEVLENICRPRFEYFNPVQTQVFHTLYHTTHNVLVGAPTGSGKTVAAELALWAAFRDSPKSKVVYIAPLKALVRERVQDWGGRLTSAMGRKLVELTGDVTPELRTIQSADIIITTPEKWDGISRSWQSRSYVKDVSLVIIDEIHLLGGDRGPILEVIVTRMNYIAAQTNRKIRVVGLSTALANANDLGDWLGIGHVGLFNFRPSVRPVPLEIYIDGFAGKQYCPRMMSMNKPTYAAIMTHSPKKPVLVFVSSRRQTRLTAQDLISLCGLDEDPKHFLHMAESDLEILLSQVKDQHLRLALGFGIGLHHAGLVESDRKISEELFINGKIQVLIATSTLAWGVNYPAHLVVIKGTEFYDAKSRTYVDFQITDVLQMMGRAGRPQFDNSGVARILVHDVKKNFYKKFLHEPFPVESSLHTCLHNHICAEIVNGSIKSKQDAMDYLTWTYLYRRLQMNPTYYGAPDGSRTSINIYMSRVVESVLRDLSAASCIEVDDDFHVKSTDHGRIASYYYLDYKTMDTLSKRLGRGYVMSSSKLGDFATLVHILCDATEFAELPVRHNEDQLNLDLDQRLPVGLNERPTSVFAARAYHHVPPYQHDDPHAKAFLLLASHFTRLSSLPSPDFYTDLVSVLDQSVRVMQAMIDLAVDEGSLSTCLGIMELLQCAKQARWPSDSSLTTLPNVHQDTAQLFRHENRRLASTAQIAGLAPNDLEKVLRNANLSKIAINDITRVVANLPLLEVKCTVVGGVEKLPGLWSVRAGQEHEIQVSVTRLNAFRQTGKGQSFRVHSPLFPKAQYEGWFVALADVAEDEMIAMKRVSASGDKAGKDSRGKYKLESRLSFVAPDEPGEADLRIMVISDGYRGLDQSINVRLLVK